MDNSANKCLYYLIPSCPRPEWGTEIKSWVLCPVFYFGPRNRSPIDPEPIFRLNYVINEKRDTFWSLKIIYYLYKNRLGTIGVLNL